MPRGTRHTLTGTLGWDERNRMYVLHMPGGGYWFVDMPGRAAQLIGRKVTVEGVRSGFNMLDVNCVQAVDGVLCVSLGSTLRVKITSSLTRNVMLCLFARTAFSTKNSARRDMLIVRFVRYMFHA